MWKNDKSFSNIDNQNRKARGGGTILRRKWREERFL